VIAYYSAEIFLESGFSEYGALAASLGFGAINFVFALPAFYTIDKFGRKPLLLTTYPLMAICLLFTGFSFWLPEHSTVRIACIALGIYLFACAYSPGSGPVPFMYSAEAYPLHVRSNGMALGTTTTWFFNFVLAITFPALLSTLKPQGAFAYYAAWNVIGFALALFFVHETKGKSLEQLDHVFDRKTSEYCAEVWIDTKAFFTRYTQPKAAAVVEAEPDSSVAQVKIKT
jgi:MFS family permease